MPTCMFSLFILSLQLPNENKSIWLVDHKQSLIREDADDVYPNLEAYF